MVQKFLPGFKHTLLSITLCWLPLLLTANDPANLIDSAVAAELSAHGIAPNSLVNDATFLRRVYLDAIGRLPTIDEAKSFLTSSDINLRSMLIEMLLGSDGYSKHWFHFWSDLLRLTTDGEITRSSIVGSAYSEWLLQALRENKPYDDFVIDLVSRTGNVWEPENAGAVGFYQRDFGMPLDHFAITMRIFLGTRIECAQCHDHPFDHWTQMDFYRMAAFTYPVRTLKYPEVYEQITRSPDPVPSGLKVAINRVTTPMRFATTAERDWPLRLPHDYQYPDASPGDVITPQIVPGSTSGLAPKASTVEEFARWMASPRNPRFARVVVNRLWEELFGRSLVIDTDDIRDGAPSFTPELEEVLIQQLVGNDFDLKDFLRTVLNSKVYQRETTAKNIAPGEPYYFQGPLLRRMSAEQLWDSLVMFITEDGERPNLKSAIYRERYLSDVRFRAGKMPDDNPLGVMKWLGSSEGRKLTSSSGRLPSNKADALAEKQKAFFASLNRFRHEPGFPALAGAALFDEWKATHYQLYRACELSSPAPRGHFLRDFGQSDRLNANNANRHASVPQALALLNGELSTALVNPYSKYARTVGANKGASEQLDAIFLGLFSRFPTSAERERLLPALTRDEEAAFRDISIAALNTARFIYIK
ncbi:MAG: DUF1549 domain-containing protein [Verrucomicrobiales bacterium]|nr:DUF1549 domain-containing protein [Verrucomicrobiales bacterium]